MVTEKLIEYGKIPEKKETNYTGTEICHAKGRSAGNKGHSTKALVRFTYGTVGKNIYVQAVQRKENTLNWY